MYYMEYKTLEGDMQVLGKAYADYLNGMEWSESEETEKRYTDEFVDEVSEVLERYVFAVDPAMMR